jgi:hypothetical protein
VGAARRSTRVDDLASLAAARTRTGARRRSPAATRLALQGLVSPLAGLEALWAAPIAWDDLAALHRLERGLVEAEVKLSTYRRALHERIDDCTAQLVGYSSATPPSSPRSSPADRPSPAASCAVRASPARRDRVHIARMRVVAGYPLVA